MLHAFPIDPLYATIFATRWNWDWENFLRTAWSDAFSAAWSSAHISFAQPLICDSVYPVLACSGSDQAGDTS